MLHTYTSLYSSTDTWFPCKLQCKHKELEYVTFLYPCTKANSFIQQVKKASHSVFLSLA